MASLHLNGCPWSVGRPCAQLRRVLRKHLPRELQRSSRHLSSAPSAGKAPGRVCQEGGQEVPSARSAQAGTGRLGVLSPSSAASTLLPAHLQPRLPGRAEGWDTGVRGSQEGSPGGSSHSPWSPSSGQEGELFTPPMATRTRYPKDYFPLHSIKQASQ